MKFNLQNDPLVQLVSPRVGDFLVLGSNPFGGNSILSLQPSLPCRNNPGYPADQQGSIFCTLIGETDIVCWNKFLLIVDCFCVAFTFSCVGIVEIE